MATYTIEFAVPSVTDKTVKNTGLSAAQAEYDFAVGVMTALQNGFAPVGLATQQEVFPFRRELRFKGLFGEEGIQTIVEEPDDAHPLPDTDRPVSQREEVDPVSLVTATISPEVDLALTVGCD